MKIIFLDVDGVLNNHQWCGSLHFEREQEFDPSCVSVINDIIAKSGAKICVSSDWRSLGLKLISAIFLKEGIVGEIIGTTCRAITYKDSEHMLQRGHEIDLWLRHDHEYKLAVPKLYANWPDSYELPESFVVIDDKSIFYSNSALKMASEIDYIAERLVQTNTSYGLESKHVDQALEILAKPFVNPWN